MNNWHVVTENHFDDFIAANAVVVLDFWAPWCQPCQGFTKILQQVATKHPAIAFGAINIDVEAGLAEEFSITSVPTLMILRQGIIVFLQAGIIPESAVNDLIDQALQLDMTAVQQKLLNEIDKS